MRGDRIRTPTIPPTHDNFHTPQRHLEDPSVIFAEPHAKNKHQSRYFAIEKTPEPPATIHVVDFPTHRHSRQTYSHLHNLLGTYRGSIGVFVDGSRENKTQVRRPVGRGDERKRRRGEGHTIAEHAF